MAFQQLQLCYTNFDAQVDIDCIEARLYQVIVDRALSLLSFCFNPHNTYESSPTYSLCTAGAPSAGYLYGCGM